MDFEKIRQNMKARKEAEELVELAGEQPIRFWEALRDIIQEKLPKVEVALEKKMGNIAARRFEDEKMPYGAHAGKTFGEIPTDYLVFLAEGNELTKKIQLYIKSDLFKQRLRREDSDLEPSD
jgi:uncharacterized protein (DUF3820 family)